MKENYSEGNLTPKDKKIAKKLLDEAKDILGSSDKPKEKTNEELLKEATSELQKEIVNESFGQEVKGYTEKIKNELLDDKSDFLTNVKKSSEYELFYKALAEEIPELGLVFDDNATETDGITPLFNHIAVKTMPYKTDRDFLEKLMENPTINLFINTANSIEEKEEVGIKLEENNLLPKGITIRILSRDYSKQMKNLEEQKKDPEWKWLDFNDLGAHLGKRYARFKNVEPLSDEEIREFMRKVVKEEYIKNI